MDDFNFDNDFKIDNDFNLDFDFNDGEKSNKPSALDGLPIKGNVEEDSKIELNAMQKAFKDRAETEDKRFELATDSEYWCSICFTSREQKEFFLSKLGLLVYGDKYLDGYEISKKFGIELPEVNAGKKF